MDSATGNEKSSRLLGIDLARAAAIVGMILDHCNRNVGTNPFSGSAWLVWLTNQLEGRVAVIFIMLAGIGMSLMSRGARQSGDPAAQRAFRRILYRRAAVLFVIGLLFHTVWDSDILHYFGVFTALGVLFLFSRSARLWTAVLLLNVVFVALLLALDRYPAWSFDAGWDWDNLIYTDFWSLSGFVRSLLFNGWFAVFPWFGFLLIGVWLGRLDLHTRAIRLRLMAWGSLLTLAAGVASWITAYHIGPKWLGMPFELSYALFSQECLPPSPFFFLQAGATAAFTIALCLEIAECPDIDRWLRPWIVFGQYALSLYVAHVLLFIIPIYLSGWTGETLWVSISTGLAAVLISLALCLSWNRRFGRGPLEMVIRRLVYGKS